MSLVAFLLGVVKHLMQLEMVKYDRPRDLANRIDQNAQVYSNGISICSSDGQH